MTPTVPEQAVTWWIAAIGRPDDSLPADDPLGPGTHQSLIWQTPAGESLRVFHRTGAPVPAVAISDGVATVFDGVLHNEAELRARFRPDPLADGSLADLAICAYRHAGAGVATVLNGWYGLLLWDPQAELLLLARDRLGIQPVYYALDGPRFFVSNGINELVAHPRVPGTVDRAVVAETLLHWPRSLADTNYRAIKRVPPGHVVQIRAGRATARRYWDPVGPGGEVQWVTQDELPQFEVLLDQAIKRCLAFGPAAIFLSGGLDSVTIAALSTDESRRTGLPAPHACSFDFPPPASEADLQRAVTAALGMPLHLATFEDLVAPEGLLTRSLALNDTWPWPLANQWMPAYSALARVAAAEGCRVILSGEGGDEWLSVGPFYAAEMLARGDVRGLANLGRTYWNSYDWRGVDLAKFLLWTYGVRPIAAAHVRSALRVAAPDRLRTRWRRSYAGLSDADWVLPDPALRREMNERLESFLDDRWAAENERGYYVPNIRGILDSVVRAMELEEAFEYGRRWGIRNLQPFWDADVVDFLFRTPPAFLSADGQTKSLVRNTLARRFPELGFERQRKVALQGYYIHIMQTQGLTEWTALGSAAALADLGVVEARGHAAAVDEIFAGRNPSTFFLVHDSLNLESWLRARQVAHWTVTQY